MNRMFDNVTVIKTAAASVTHIHGLLVVCVLLFVENIHYIFCL